MLNQAWGLADTADLYNCRGHILQSFLVAVPTLGAHSPSAWAIHSGRRYGTPGVSDEEKMPCEAHSNRKITTQTPGTLKQTYATYSRNYTSFEKQLLMY